MAQEPMTEREWGLLLRCGTGMSRARAGRVYDIGESHVSTIIRRAVRKLDAESVAHAFAVGLATGVYVVEDITWLEEQGELAVTRRARDFAKVQEADRKACD
ncbi:hypothetical protein [Streptomyces sp. NPDC050504]|uniref:hypothetical protein n=1 Tax=Streptomyces sp. NPDC050504 TaxID=3365618 RepID=UPI003797A815